MGNPDNSRGFGPGNLIDQFKARMRDVVRQANAQLEPVHQPLQAINRQMQQAAGKAAQKVREADRYLQQKHDQLHQNQRESGAKLQKSWCAPLI